MLREVFSSQLFYNFKDGICDQLEAACDIIERLQTENGRLAHLHKLDHSLADQWQTKNAQLEAKVEQQAHEIKRLRADFKRAANDSRDNFNQAERL